MATGAGWVSVWACGAAATEDWGEHAPTAKATIATPARRFATNSDISANPRSCDRGDDIDEIDRLEKPKFSRCETMDHSFTPSCYDAPHKHWRGQKQGINTLSANFRYAHRA